MCNVQTSNGVSRRPWGKRTAFWGDIHPRRGNIKYQFLYLPGYRGCKMIMRLSCCKPEALKRERGGWEQGGTMHPLAPGSRPPHRGG